MKVKRYVPSGVIIKNRIILIIILIIMLIVIRFFYFYGKGKALSIIPKDGNMKFTVQFCSADLLQNNSVGNNWSFEANVNGERIKEKDKYNSYN